MKTLPNAITPKYAWPKTLQEEYLLQEIEKLKAQNKQYFDLGLYAGFIISLLSFIMGWQFG